MNYVRTSGGGMMPITFKSGTLLPNKKEAIKIKPTRKLKKAALTEPK